MTGPVELSTPTATRPAGRGPDVYDGPDQLAAQRTWLAILRGEVGPDHQLTDRQWTCLADEATRHRLCGVTYRRLADGPLADRAPREVRERLRPFYVEAATRNALLFRQTSLVVQQLAAKGIPVMLLKGIHLARFVYAEPGLRSMADIDIMVHREHLAEAERVYLDRGFGPLPRTDIAERCGWSNHLAKLEKAGAGVVELHWSIERPKSSFRIDLDGLWERSRTATLDGATVRLLSPEDLLLHLSLHLSYHHRFDRAALKGLVDIATVIAAHGNEIQWGALGERAVAWGASGYLYTTLRLVVGVLGAPVPASLFAALPHEPADEEIVAVARRYVLQLDKARHRVYVELAQGGTLLERARLVLAAVFLPRQKMETIYGHRAGTALIYPYYGLRVLSLLRKRSGLLLQTLFRTRGVQPTLDRESDRLVLDQWGGPPPG